MRAERIMASVCVACLACVIGCGRGAGEGGGSTGAAELSWASSYRVARDRAASEGKPVMVDFYTDWCGWCRRLDSTTLADRRVQRALERFVLVRLNAEREGREVAGRFGVQGYPTLVFLDSGGREVGRIPGFVEADGFLQELEGVLRRL